MTRVLLMIALLSALGLAACGSSHKHATPAQKAEAQQEATKFETLAGKCLARKGGALNLSVLRTKQGRHTFTTCLVPVGQRGAFESCAEKAVVGRFNRVAVESGLNSCARRVS